MCNFHKVLERIVLIMRVETALALFYKGRPYVQVESVYRVFFFSGTKFLKIACGS